MNKPVQPPLEDDPVSDDLAAELEALGPPPGDGRTEEELDAEAEADIAAGRVVSHEIVREWLLELRTNPRAPRPRPWLK